MALLTVGHGPEDRHRLGGRRTVSVMCSECVWWRCHRRLVADVAVLGRDVPMRHLMPDGRLPPHRPSDGAVRGDDGLLRWPAQGPRVPESPARQPMWG